MPPLRLGILGMEHAHAPGLVDQISKRPEQFELIGGFDPRSNVAAQRLHLWQQNFPAFQCFASADELFDASLDAVVIEGATEQNVTWAQRSVERGLHVLLEKPAGLNYRDFAAVSRLAQQAGLQLQMLYLFRYMSAVQYLLKAVGNGELGQIYQYRARLPKDFRLYDELVKSYQHLPGGIFFEMACHAIDIMIAALGEPLNVQSLTRHHSQNADDFLDNGAALFEYPNAIGQIEVTALEIATDARRFEIYGTEGAIVIPNLGSGHLENNRVQRVQRYRRDSGWETIDLPAATLQSADLAEFHARVADGKPAEFDPDHDLAVQRWLVRSC
ncbi:MAG: putative dehydrogenase, partial [Pirellulaceae bacterium]